MEVTQSDRKYTVLEFYFDSIRSFLEECLQKMFHKSIDKQ